MNETDITAQMLELIEGAVRRALDTGVAQTVDVTSVMAEGQVAMMTLWCQRAIDAATKGTPLTGYVCPIRRSHSTEGLLAVIRGLP